MSGLRQSTRPLTAFFLIAQADAEDKQEKPATKKKTSTRKKK